MLHARLIMRCCSSDDIVCMKKAGRMACGKKIPRPFFHDNFSSQFKRSFHKGTARRALKNHSFGVLLFSLEFYIIGYINFVTIFIEMLTS